MNFGNATDWVVIAIAQVGPTELFVPDQVDAVSGGGATRWMLWGLMIVLLVIAAVWIRGMGQQRVDPRELAFRSLARKIGLSSKQISAIRAIAQRDGVHPVGLLMAPSAIRSSGADS